MTSATATETETKHDGNEWVTRLAVPGTLLLEPFTSDGTRAGGKQLVLTSVVTLLVSANVISLTGGSISMFGVVIGRFFDVFALLGVACLYLTVTYALDLYRDWKVSHYKRLPGMVEGERLRTELAFEHAERDKRLHSDIQQLKTSAEAELKKVQELGEAMRRRPAVDPVDLDSLLPRAPRADRALEAERWHAPDGARHDRDAAVSRARIEGLLDVHETMKRLDRYRLVAEVVFPTVLSLSAIGVCIYRLIVLVR